MTDGVIGTVLSSIFSWETEAVRARGLLRKSIMNEVDVAGSPLLVVLDEAVVEMAARHVVGRVLVVP